jgi:hypothetical protein
MPPWGAGTLADARRGSHDGRVLAVLYRLRCGVRSRWATTVGLALVVAILGGVVLTLVAGSVRTLTAPDRYNSALPGGYDASVQQHGGRPRTAEVAALPAVEHTESATFVFAGLVADGGSRDDGIDGLVFAGSPAAVGTRLVDGREPDPAAPGEFVATRSFVASAGASLGDTFELWVIPQGPAASSGFDAADQAIPLLTATLVGVADGLSELSDGTPMAVFPVTLLDAGDVGISATQSVVSLAPGATVDDLRAQLDGLPDGSQFGIDPGDVVPSTVRAAVRAQGQGLGIVAAIAAVAMIVVTGQVLSRQVRLPEVERLVLASTGMSPGQLVAEPLLVAAVPVAVGMSAAVALAYGASGLFPAGFVRHIEPDPGRRFDAVTLVPGAFVLAGLVLAWVLAALVVARRARPPVRPATGVEVLARRAPAQVATALRFAFTRQAREANRPRAAVVGTVVLLVVLVGALTFGASLGELVERPAWWGDNFDLGVGQGGGELPTAVRARLENDADVAALTLFGTVPATVGADGFDVTAMLPIVGSASLHLFEGRLAQGADEIALGRVAARRLGVGVGDDLLVTGPAGARTLRVTGLAVLPGVEGADGVGEGGLVTFDGLHRLDPSAGATWAGIRLRPGAAADAAQRISTSTGMTVGRLDRPSVIVNVARVRSMPYLIAAILAALVVLNLAHQLILATYRLRRDLAVLRALGASGRWVSGVVHWQATLFTMLVVALGAPLGIAAGRVVYRAFVERTGALDTTTLPVGLFAVTVIAFVALANVVALPSAHRARRRLPARNLADE